MKKLFKRLFTVLCWCLGQPVRQPEHHQQPPH